MVSYPQINKDFWVVNSKTDGNTYFLFRAINDKDCLEIKIIIRNNLILTDHNLHPEEANYIRTNILQKGEKIIK